MKTICIDFDDTYTADPPLWDRIIPIMRQHGWVIICATMRYKEEGKYVEESIGKLVDHVFYTGRQAKKTYLTELGVKVDIWIDDRPEWLFADG